MLIPLLISASGGALHSITAADETAIPPVPSKPYDQPASVQQAVAMTASPVAAVVDVAANDLPAPALLAYRRTETLLSDSDPQCKLPWTLVAAIGRVESDHGRTGGNSLDAGGVARPGIYGIPLDGSDNTAKISDTDQGKLDKDRRWDRAIGPMQFIPGTWTSVAIDSDNDGKSDPQNIFDATAAAGVYLCAGTDDLSTDKGARSAVHRYNHSDSYVDKVLAIAKQYASGTFTDPPSTLFAAPPLTTELAPAPPLKKAQGTAPEKTAQQEKATAPAKTPGKEPEVTTGEEPTPDPKPTTDEEPTPAPDETPEPDPTPTPDATDKTGASVSPTPTPTPDPTPTPTDPFVGTELEARALCLATGRYVIDSIELGQCVLTLMKTRHLPVPVP
ncbi:MAG: lytic murein transglycosylase [Aeromicrobium sp.]